MPELRVRYLAPPTVGQMMKSNARVRCIVGPRGSGKSSGCVMEILRRAGEQAPDRNGNRCTKFAVVRNTYRELTDTTRPTFEKWIPQEMGTWSESDLSFSIDCPLDDGTRLKCEVLFRSLNRPADAKKLLSLELTGAYVNEAKEIPKAILDGLKGAVGRYPSMDDGGPTWHGVWMDTNPWPVIHWGYKLFKKPPEGYELYKQPGGRTPEAENLAKLVPSYYADLATGADEEWIKAYVDGEYPQSQQGAVYANQLEPYVAERFDHPLDGVYATYDLGKSDSTAIWYWRLNGSGGVDVINHYEAHGKELSHYFAVNEATGYDIKTHWLPHDARAHTLASRLSVEDQFRDQYKGRVQIGPELSIEDGIAAGRWLLEQKCRFHERCAEGMETLAAYHFEWDDDLKTYSKNPVHDWASHTADSWRYLALVALYTMKVNKKPAPIPSPIIPSHDRAWNLDQLFADNEKHKRERV